MMRRFGSNCHIVQFEVCNPGKVKKPPPPPPPPPPRPPLGCKVVQNRIDMSSPNVICFPRTMKVPVVLAELVLQVCIDVDITLERPALEIKRVNKDVSLDECKLVPTSRKNHFKLFISGFIRKSIEYATAGPVPANANAVCGSILHTTAHIPFNSCTEVTFEGKNFPNFLVSSDTETRFLDKSSRGSKIEQKLFSHSVHYNEEPYCELVAFEINEFDFAKKGSSTHLPHITNERTFTTVQEQIVLDLLVKVLQNQQIPISGKHDHDEECEKRWDCDHDHNDGECCDHGHRKKCRKKCKKKCDHDHDDDDDDDDDCDHGHGKKCRKKCKKCDHDDDDDDDDDCDHGHGKKCRKKCKKRCLKKYRRKT
ncbi:CsxC family protein [Shimazuella kribbensis]|uniref:CsxC family protein n=1 Tax=Shimazuella kribbensis TaxID=139808 RepID=UPI00041C3E02|nr:hypothetical protein [Shimazuella kribbensis]